MWNNTFLCGSLISLPTSTIKNIQVLKALSRGNKAFANRDPACYSKWYYTEA